MKFRIHPLFYLTVLVSILLGMWVFLVALLIVVLVHELSHMLAASHYGAKPTMLRLLPFGAELEIDSENLTTKQMIVVYLAGPIGNVVFALMASGFLWLAPQYFSFVQYIVIASIFPAVLNLIPIYPLDGGKIVALRKREKISYERLITSFGDLQKNETLHQECSEQTQHRPEQAPRKGTS